MEWISKRQFACVVILLHFISGVASSQDYHCFMGNRTAIDIANKGAAVDSGNPYFDQFMVQHLTNLSVAFQVTVPVYILTKEKNADSCFVPLKFPELIVADHGNPEDPITGSIFITMGLLDKEAKMNSNYESIPAVLAHEMTHGMQHKNNFPYKYKWPELHADYMAGWYVAHLGWSLYDRRFNNAMQLFYSLGECAINDPSHHGTPCERATAFYAGFLFGKAYPELLADYAYGNAIAYIRFLGAQ